MTGRDERRPYSQAKRDFFFGCSGEIRLCLSGALASSVEKPRRKLFSHAFLNIDVNRRFQISRWSHFPTLHHPCGQYKNFQLSVDPKMVMSTGL